MEGRDRLAPPSPQRDGLTMTVATRSSRAQAVRSSALPRIAPDCPRPVLLIGLIITARLCSRLSFAARTRDRSRFFIAEGKPDAGAFNLDQFARYVDPIRPPVLVDFIWTIEMGVLTAIGSTALGFSCLHGRALQHSLQARRPRDHPLATIRRRLRLRSRRSFFGRSGWSPRMFCTSSSNLGDDITDWMVLSLSRLSPSFPSPTSLSAACSNGLILRWKKPR